MAASTPAPSGAHHHKNPRKESFMAFASDKFLAFSAQTEPHEEAPSPQSVRDRSGTWDRLSHATHLLGYALCMSFFCLLYLVYLATQRWAQPGGEGGGVPVLDRDLIRNGIFVPALVSYTIN